MSTEGQEHFFSRVFQTLSFPTERLLFHVVMLYVLWFVLVEGCPQVGIG